MVEVLIAEISSPVLVASAPLLDPPAWSDQPGAAPEWLQPKTPA
jgi:hypothetical protein